MSWAGDVFLMLDPDFFVFGLASFLVAQVFYILVYSHAVTVNGIKTSFRLETVFILSLLLIYGTYLVGRIQIQLGNLFVPVIIYALSLLVMVFMAYLRKGRTGRISFLLVYAGALTFLASDSMLAISRFESPFAYDRYWIMLTYILAQFLIVNGLVAHVRHYKSNQ